MEQLQQLIQSNYFVGIVTILGVLFISLARPPLPPAMIQFFELPIVTVIMYALIVLLLTQNLQVAIIVAVAFYVLMNIIREQKIGEGFVAGLREEGFFSQVPEEFDAMQSVDYTQGPYDSQYKKGVNLQLPTSTDQPDSTTFPTQYLSATNTVSNTAVNTANTLLPQYDQTVL